MQPNLPDLLKAPFNTYTPADVLRHMQQRANVTYFALRDEEQAGPAQIAGVLANHFAYNEESYQLPANFDWTVNPSADLEWLILLHKFYFAPGLGDEFSQHGDMRYAQKWVDLTTAWIDTVPLDFLSSDVTGRRVQNWIFAHYYFVTATQSAVPVLYSNQFQNPSFSSRIDRQSFEQSASPVPVKNSGFHSERSITADFYAKFLCSLHRQVQYLCNNLTSARNHRTIELYAIFMAAVVFPEFADAAVWLAFARHELEQNIQADLRADGVHCEQSTDYHHLVVKNYLGVKRLAVANGLTFAPIFDDLLQRALDFAMFAHRPDGTIPAISDGDARSFLDLLQQGHAIYNNPAWHYVATCGRAGTAPAERSCTFPAGGYTILRSGWGEGTTAFADERYLIFDCGPLGEGNHGHLDLLTIEAAAFGKALVVDPGRYTYYEPQPDPQPEWGKSKPGETNWRVHFRGTAAHNTVQVDGLEQTRYCFHKKKFKVRGPEPIWELRTFQRHADHEIVHGYAASAEYEAIHQRIICFAQGTYWIITDILHAASAHRYDLRFHLNDHADGQTALERDEITTFIRSPHLLLAQPADEETSVSLDDGFVSRTYGVKHAAPVVRYSRYAADTIFQTVLYPYKTRAPELRVEQLSADQSSSYHKNALVAGLRTLITENGHGCEDTFCLLHSETGTGYDYAYDRQPSRLLANAKRNPPLQLATQATRSTQIVERVASPNARA